MEEVFKFLRTYEVWIYVVIGLVGVIYMRNMLVSWQEWRGAIFGLEKENAQRRFSTSLSVLVLLFLVAMFEFFFVSFVAPAYPQERFLPTPTISLLVTPTITLPATTSTPEGGALLVSTQVVPSSEGCIPGQIEWLSPAKNAEISGRIELKGLIKVDNVGLFKYEYSQVGTDKWMTIAGGNQDVIGTTPEPNSTPEPGVWSGAWSTEGLVPGDYLLRMVVTDNQTNALPACVIPVRVIASQK
jgi:hypothetical protein